MTAVFAPIAGQASSGNPSHPSALRGLAVLILMLLGHGGIAGAARRRPSVSGSAPPAWQQENRRDALVGPLPPAQINLPSFDQHGRDGRVEYHRERACRQIHGWEVAATWWRLWQWVALRHGNSAMLSWALPRRVPILRAVMG